MTVPVITAAFSITYFAITIWLVRRVKLDVRSICYASVICALTVVLAGIRIPLPTGSNITCGTWRRSSWPAPAMRQPSGTWLGT